VILIKDPDPTNASKRKFVWKWIRGTAAIGDFGDPAAGGESYTMCIYDDNNLVWSPSVQGGGMCGTKPCWKASPKTGTAKRYRYRNKATNTYGIFKVLMKAGTGNAKILVKGKGGNLVLPLPVNQTTNVTVQLLRSTTSGTQCWEAVFPAPAKKNKSTLFRDVKK